MTPELAELYHDQAVECRLLGKKDLPTPRVYTSWPPMSQEDRRALELGAVKKFHVSPFDAD